MNREKISCAIICGGLLSLAAFFIYLPYEIGAALTIPPDSSEYAIGLSNLLEHGRFGITLNGEWYPSRYSPWFSLSCLTPAYFLSGGNVLCLHWAILVFALVLLVVIWKMGSLCGLGRLAILPPVLIMFIPDFLFYSRVVMTEVPYAALVAFLALLFVRFSNQVQVSIKFCLCVGLLIAWSGFVRSTGYTLIVPFGVVILFRFRMGWKKGLVSLSAMGLPIVTAQLVNMWYNWMTFGSPFRSGYHYWCAVPMDFPGLAFNLKYVVPTAVCLLRQPIIQATLVFLSAPLLFAVYLVAKRAFREYRVFLLLMGYVGFHLLVLLILYLGYYWIDTRFFFPITICSLLLFFVTVNSVLSIAGDKARIFLTAVVFIMCMIIVVLSPTRYLYMTMGRPVWLAQAQIAGAVLPPGAVVIQRGDPNVLDHFGFKDKGLTLYPFCRAVDYVMRMTAPNRITHLVDTPASWHQEIIPELVDSGVCRMPFPDVFEESPEKICKYVTEGRRVFVLQNHFLCKESFESFNSRLEGMGLSLKIFGIWNVPKIEPNPLRHFYDRLLFPGYDMDSRPEITVIYYEIVVAEGHDTSPLGLSDIKQGEGDKK